MFTKPTTVQSALTAGVLFVALNDDPDVMNKRTIAESLSVVTLSAAFGIAPSKIAKMILDIRKNAA